MQNHPSTHTPVGGTPVQWCEKSHRLLLAHDYHFDSICHVQSHRLCSKTGPSRVDVSRGQSNGDGDWKEKNDAGRQLSAVWVPVSNSVCGDKQDT